MVKQVVLEELCVVHCDECEGWCDHGQGWKDGQSLIPWCHLPCGGVRLILVGE